MINVHGLRSDALKVARLHRATPYVCIIATLALVLPSCRKSEPTFEIITLEGKIEEIDATSESTGEITVLYYSEKHKQDMMGTGLITPETEIMINGAMAKLADLREGDRVRGEVRVDKRSGEQTQTALKINVDRAEPTGPEGG